MRGGSFSSKGGDDVEAIQQRKMSIQQLEHRDDDDRAEEAKGRNSDAIDRKYWFSVNFIGSMFAIGMSFMGGIGGQ